MVRCTRERKRESRREISPAATTSSDSDCLGSRSHPLRGLTVLIVPSCTSAATTWTLDRASRRAEACAAACDPRSVSAFSPLASEHQRTTSPGSHSSGRHRVAGAHVLLHAPGRNSCRLRPRRMHHRRCFRRWSHRTGIRFPPALLPVSKLNHTMLCTTGADVSASWCLGPACRGSPYQLFSPVRREQSSRLTPRAPATYAKLDHQVQRRHRGKHRHG